MVKTYNLSKENFSDSIKALNKLPTGTYVSVRHYNNLLGDIIRTALNNGLMTYGQIKHVNLDGKIRWQLGHELPVVAGHVDDNTLFELKPFRTTNYTRTREHSFSLFQRYSEDTTYVKDGSVSITVGIPPYARKNLEFISQSRYVVADEIWNPQISLGMVRTNLKTSLEKESSAIIQLQIASKVASLFMGKYLCADENQKLKKTFPASHLLCAYDPNFQCFSPEVKRYQGIQSTDFVLVDVNNRQEIFGIIRPRGNGALLRPARHRDEIISKYISKIIYNTQHKTEVRMPPVTIKLTKDGVSFKRNAQK